MRIKVEASRNYDVVIGKGILKDAGSLISEIYKGKKIAVITDDRVNALYADICISSLEREGYDVIKFVFENGEKSKNISTLNSILEFLAVNHLTRGDIIAALGGGVCGDMTGFAAAVYLRGLQFVQIPTTLLAAVDSSVGGKTAVNLESGKNLVGSFWQPSLVICDTSTFDTLPPEIYSDGMAEVIKYGVISDKDLFENLDVMHCEEIVQRCVEHKRDIVFKDEFDNGERQLLNFGHTIGHAIERVSNYKISHGNAVATGMVKITRGAEEMSLCEKGSADKIAELLSKYNLMTDCEYTSEDLAEAALNDKKSMGEYINIVIPEKIGKCRLHKINTCDFIKYIG